VSDRVAPSPSIDDRVTAFYHEFPYPPPVDDIKAYRARWDDARRRAESCLLWPGEPYRESHSILVAGCGTTQAARYAVRWPGASVVGIDVSDTSIEFTQGLKARHGLSNLEVRRLTVERVAELAASFDHVVCTGVLHHLADPDAGLRALRQVVRPSGALSLMVYAPYGRTGVYMIQEYCRRLGIENTAGEIRDLAETLATLPPDHPLVPLLRNSPDFATPAGLADALLHPSDRAYSVPQLFDYLGGAGFAFGRWVRQAPYLPWCGAIAASPHAQRLQALALKEQFAAMELARGTMVRHALIAYRDDDVERAAIDFEGDAWRDFVPIRVPDTIAVSDRALPAGASAVLINPNHSYTDLYLPIDERQRALFDAIDGKQTIGEICARIGSNGARSFFERLWRWDQAVFDVSLC
jgi:SAM-dependent methyltransferase